MIYNFIHMTASTAIRSLSKVVILFLIARLWGPEIFGSFMYSYILSSILALVMDYGNSLSLVKNVSQNTNKISIIVILRIIINI